MDSNFWFTARVIEASEVYRDDLMSVTVMDPASSVSGFFLNPVASHLKVPLA